MWLLAVLTSDCVNGFFYEEMYGRFAGLKKTGHDKQVTILSRWL